MALKRLFQVVAKEEVQAGSAAAALYSAANANYLVIDPSLEFNPEQFDRANINRASLSPFSPLAGVVTGQASFQLELSGTGSSTTPAWGQLLKACGMQEVVTVQLEITAAMAGSTTQAFFNGETVTGAGGGTGIVCHDTYEGELRLLLHTRNGTAFVAAEAITGGTSGTTGVVGAAGDSTAFGTSWIPDSIELQQLHASGITGTNDAGDVVIGATSGAIGILQEAVTGAALYSIRVLDGIFLAETLNNATQTGTITEDLVGAEQTNVPSISLAIIEDGPAKALKGARGTFTIGGNIGEAVLFNFEFQGLKNAITDEGTVTGVTYNSQVPPVMLGVTFDVWDDDRADSGTPTGTFSPRFQSLSLDFANTTGIGRDAGETTGVYGSAHITARATSGSMTIDVAPEGAFAFLEAVSAGTPTHLKLQIGSTVGNKFILSCPSAVFTGESGGDTEGIATRDLPFRVGSRAPDGTEADDCELILTYQHTA